MSRTNLVPVATPTPSEQVFSPAAWANLAGKMVGQDIVVMPVSSEAITLDAPYPEAESVHRKASALALVKHWGSMGFVLPKKDVVRLCEQDHAVHVWLHRFITPALRERLGGHVHMTPMYPNFPKQVMELSEAELYYNAILHYAGDVIGERVVPETKVKKRKDLGKAEGRERVLRLADMDGVREALAQLTQMNAVWTPSQAALAVQALPLLLEWQLVGAHTALPQRENQARMRAAWLQHFRTHPTIPPVWPASRVSATDILRAAVAYSGGDPSLASTSAKVNFTKLSRPQRRLFMSALESAMDTTKTALEDLHRYRSSWLRLGEKLHAGEWKGFPLATSAISDLRNSAAPVSWAGHLDALMATTPDKAGLARLNQLAEDNPGSFARALRRALLWAGEAHAKAVVKSFSAVASRVDTPVLLALDASLRADISSPDRARVMLPKGAAAWRYRVEGYQRAVPVAEKASKLCQDILRERFATLAPLGKVHVEEGLDDIIVPKGLRSASDSVGVVTRGSWLPVEGDARIIRLFLWWQDTDQGRVDIDLSAVGVDENFRHTETCNFQALREAGMVHSGDLTSAPEGAAEFIDVNLDRVKKTTRYVVLSANVFCGPGFDQIPDCFLGWQERQKPGRGEIMELKTVVEKFRITAKTKGFLGAVFDTHEKRMMWLDLPMNARSGMSIHGGMENIQQAVEDFQLYAASQPKMGHLVDLHIASRGGVRVSDPDEADVRFTLAPRMPKKGQVIIAANQPQAVASNLLPSAPVRGSAAPDAEATSIEHTPAEPVRVEPVKAKVPRQR